MFAEIEVSRKNKTPEAVLKEESTLKYISRKEGNLKILSNLIKKFFDQNYDFTLYNKFKR